MVRHPISASTASAFIFLVNSGPPLKMPSQELFSLGEFVALPFVFRCRNHLLGCDLRNAQVSGDRRFVSRRRVPDPVRQAFGRLREIVFLAREYENSITFGVLTREDARAHYTNKPDATLPPVEGLTTRALVQVPAYHYDRTRAPRDVHQWLQGPPSVLVSVELTPSERKHIMESIVTNDTPTCRMARSSLSRSSGVTNSLSLFMMRACLGRRRPAGSEVLWCPPRRLQ